MSFMHHRPLMGIASYHHVPFYSKGQNWCEPRPWHSLNSLLQTLLQLSFKIPSILYHPHALSLLLPHVRASLSILTYYSFSHFRNSFSIFPFSHICFCLILLQCCFVVLLSFFLTKANSKVTGNVFLYFSGASILLDSCSIETEEPHSNLIKHQINAKSMKWSSI